MTKVYVVFYSMYGHVYEMAEAVTAGAGEIEGVEASLFQVPELASEESLARTGADKARAVFAHIPVINADQLPEADAIIFGAPTRFGNMCAQMRSFLDRTGALWAKGALIGKVGSFFTSSATQHGGQETTIVTSHVTLLHHGMVIVGLPYSAQGQTRIDEITGGSPYGASTITGGDGSRRPSENELELARFQGRHVAAIAKKLSA
ncbi:MAG: NAD(P)H:quinone oxidoreductase [Blastocatellales bacterium]|nr:NAD(P)H:quinone oxidoreductase [Blastocatellales bacterium]